VRLPAGFLHGLLSHIEDRGRTFLRIVCELLPGCRALHSRRQCLQKMYPYVVFRYKEYKYIDNFGCDYYSGNREEHYHLNVTPCSPVEYILVVSYMVSTLMKEVHFSDTSVSFYRTTRPYIPEDIIFRRFALYCIRLHTICVY
jgi:hypothetical protein